jgi:hypothetical protein
MGAGGRASQATSPSLVDLKKKLKKGNIPYINIKLKLRKITPSLSSTIRKNYLKWVKHKFGSKFSSPPAPEIQSCVRPGQEVNTGVPQSISES